MSQRTCSIENCANKSHARGWCKKHYTRFLRHGSPHSTKYQNHCDISGCEKLHYAKGLCSMHYQRNAKHGDPEKTLLPRDSELSFTNNVEWRGSCLIWTGTVSSNGYGQISTGAQTRMPSHCYAWERENGPIPDGMHIDHRYHCDTLCCNVEHLRLSTRSQNGSNRKGPAGNNKTSGFRNVSEQGTGWKVQIMKNGKRYYAGGFKTASEAAKVAEHMRKEIFGDFAGRG